MLQPRKKKVVEERTRCCVSPSLSLSLFYSHPPADEKCPELVTFVDRASAKIYRLV